MERIQPLLRRKSPSRRRGPLSPLNGRAKGGPEGPPAASCRVVLLDLDFVAPFAATAYAFSLYYTFLLPFQACRKLADLFLHSSRILRILRIPLLYCCFSFSIYRSLLYSARPNLGLHTGFIFMPRHAFEYCLVIYPPCKPLLILIALVVWHHKRVNPQPPQYLDPV